MSMYDVLIIGAGPGGIFTAYELTERRPDLKIAIFEHGHELSRRKCPIDGEKIKSCIHCNCCSIMSGFGGAGAFSDGKYNITNDFGGTLYEYIGKKTAIELMEYVDKINLKFGGEGTKLYSTAGTKFKKICMQHGLHLLDASVRHLGTDINYVVLEHLYDHLKDKVDFFFDCCIDTVEKTEKGYRVYSGERSFEGKKCVISAGRSGSKWMEKVCADLDIPTNSNRVDLGVRVELPAEIFSDLTDELYESKIVYRTEKYEDNVRTFCMNPKGAVVNENTNGIVTVNGHSYEDPAKQTKNTNFALLVAKHFSEPFKDSNEYGESIARLSNMLGGGVIVQRFGDLIRGKRSTEQRIRESFTVPTLNAAAGDLSLVLPKRILDGIIEMIYALDKVAPGTANDDTLLYGVEVKFYNMEVEVDENLMTRHDGLYVIGDSSGITHSLSHASASGVYVARQLTK
ncbi:MAG: NAD(P)/FAD-dependent oxidoreductase [Lachnospiraceae bacterium]|nr:NAD(P)/FAD-dependent oxidoreductase [Lachnospiraceae bacterium]